MEKSGEIVKRACSFIRYLRVIRKYWQEKTLKLINVPCTFIRHLRVLQTKDNATTFPTKNLD